MTRPPIIGLYSPAPQSGKSTVASLLAQHGYKLCSFATPLKRLTYHVLTELGISETRADNYVHRDKEELIPELGVSARHMLRTLGTEWGRQCIHPDLWLRCWRLQVEVLLAQNCLVVVDDTRFPNEATAIRALGGELWRVTRSETPNSPEHASEGALDRFTFDVDILNDSDLHTLKAITTQALLSRTTA